MSATKPAVQIGPRDEAILLALDQSPLTTAQLRRLSVTFERPFTDEHSLRRRLRQLADSGLVRAYPYAVASLGRSPSYFRLTPKGFRQLYGAYASMPSRRSFSAVADANHAHTHALAEFIVTLMIAADRAGCEVLNFARENSVVIETPTIKLRADAAFELAVPGRQPLRFVVELDNGTERVRSTRDVESIERKVRGYLEHQEHIDVFDERRYVVLFVTTRSTLRLNGILHACRELATNPQRRLFLGIGLAEFVAADNPLFAKLFTDPFGHRASLCPTPSRQPRSASRIAPPVPALC